VVDVVVDLVLLEGFLRQAGVARVVLDEEYLYGF
jgi:hypothetical protein